MPLGLRIQLYFTHFPPGNYPVFRGQPCITQSDCLLSAAYGWPMSSPAFVTMATEDETLALRLKPVLLVETEPRAWKKVATKSLHDYLFIYICIYLLMKATLYTKLCICGSWTHHQTQIVQPSVKKNKQTPKCSSVYVFALTE